MSRRGSYEKIQLGYKAIETRLIDMQETPLLIGAAGIEIFLFVAACAVLLADLFLPTDDRQRLHWAVVAGLGVAAMAAFGEVSSEPVVALNGFFIFTPLVAVLKGIILLAVAACLIFSSGMLRAHKMLHGDFFALALLATMGMLVIVSAAHFLTLYLGLELMSLSLYAMIGLRRDNAAASEAAIKYFVLGALASGLFLYGVSMIYGATGELSIAEVARVAATAEVSKTVLVLGLVFMLAGLAFKLGVAPFHMWLPDVYHAAPLSMTLFIASAPKVAILAMLLRVLMESLAVLQPDWRQMLMILAVLSLAVGNITAIAQTDLKRMLAYSAIAHSGFLVLGVLAGGATGAAAAVFYIAAYVLMTIGGFGAIILLSVGTEERSRLADVKGLAARCLPVALVVAILMLSLAGIPPMVGFFAKFVVLKVVVEAGQVWLAVVAILFSLVGAFYYLRVIRLMFFEKPDEEEAIRLPLPATALLILIGFLVVWYGVLPGDWLSLIEEVVERSQ